MPIYFLSPNPEQKEALDELEKLISVLEIKPSKKLKRNVRFVRGFTRGLLIAGKKYSEHKARAKAIQSINKIEIKEVKSSEMHDEEKKQPASSNNLPISPLMPLPPPPPPARTISSMPMPGSNIKGGGKSFENFIQKVSKDGGVLKFNIIEPEMEPVDWKIFNEVKSKLKQQIIKNPNALEGDAFLMNEIKNTCQRLKIKYSDSYLKKIKYYLIKYIKGFGKMDPLISNPDISEIICNSYNDVKVKYKNELISTNIQFDTNEELDNFLLNVAEKSNKELSENNPELITILQNLKISAFFNPIMGSRFIITKQ